jgi:LysM repeat protein
MNRITVLAFAFTFLAQLLPAQNVTYVIFNRDCMNQLVYRYAYPNVKGEDPVFAYSVKPNVLENYVFIAEGAGHYSPTMPAGAVSCRSLDLNDGFVASINRDERQMNVVFQRQEGGYWLMPIGSATLVARNNSKYWVRSKNCSFTFDTLRMENDMNLAVAGSPTAVYFKGAQLRDCLMEYSFHCESAKSGQLRSDIELIPSLGFTSDRTGASSAKALENEMQLSRVNGKNIDDFIEIGCPEDGKITVSKTQKPTQYGYEKETYGYSETDKETASIKSSRPVEYNYDGESVSVNCAEKLGDGYHVVQKGDNLRGIARTYGVDVASLVKWNNIKDPNKIEICQTIWYQKPPANATKTATKGAEKPIQHSTDYKVVDQRKLSKINSGTAEKGVKAQTYSTEDEDYDSWRQKATKKTPAEKPQQYAYYDEPTADTEERPLIHKVKKGEYLYKLAKQYDCPEECIRQANNMPEEGDVDFIIGQKIIIPECDCLKPSKSKTTPKNAPYEEPVNTGQKKKKIQGSTLLDPVTYGYDDQEPQKEGKKDPENKVYEDEWPLDEADKAVSSAKTKAGTTKKGVKDNATVPQFKEHLVRQGDTLRSIATKYKVDPAELAQVNGLGLNEAVTPGKWLLVPIESVE